MNITETMCNQSNDESSDLFFYYYSGHGSQINDINLDVNTQTMSAIFLV